MQKPIVEARSGRRPEIAKIEAFPRVEGRRMLMVLVVSDASGTDQIYVQGNVDGEPNQITYMEGGAQHPSWSPRSDRIIFHSPADGGIWTVGILGSPPPMKLIPEGKNPRYSFRWQYDRLRTPARDPARRQRRCPAAFRARRAVTQLVVPPHIPTLSPDGRNIVGRRRTSGRSFLLGFHKHRTFSAFMVDLPVELISYLITEGLQQITPVK